MIRYNSLKLLCGAMTLLGLAACSDATDELKGVEDNGTTYKVYKLDITAGNEAENATRSLSLNDKNVVLSKWAADDQMFVYNCSDDETKSNIETYSTVKTQNSGAHSAKFMGDIYSQNRIVTTDKLAFFYPGSAIDNPNNVVASVPVTETIDQYEYDEENDMDKKVGTIDVTTYEPSTTIKNQVILNLSEQDGTLATIDANYDYNWGTASPTNVDESNGTVTANVNLNRLVSFWGLKFTNESNTAITNIKTVYINGIKSTEVLKLDDGSFIGGDQDKDFTIEVRNGGNSIIGDNGYIWIAFFPEVSAKINITVVTTDGTIYSKELSTTFAVNKTYRSTIRRMAQPKAEPYVEVAGVKWATGNFIRYTNGVEDYWGIAPAQWWISNYADMPTNADWVDLALQRVEVKAEQPGSQHWYINNHETGFGMSEQDCDLFDFGVINDAFSFKEKKYLTLKPVLNPDTRNIEGKWFTKGFATTTDRTKAYFGDIAHFYTTVEGRNHPYRYPTRKELTDLMKAKTVIPAYCYSDKGNKIYGAYFSDMETGGLTDYAAVKGFPTGKGMLWKFEDVTGLVLVNKGLFLPITGFMYGVVNQNRVNYRLVDYGNKFSAHYWSSNSTVSATATGLAFGSDEWVYGAAQKTQATAIRPVYIGTEEQAELPVDASKYNMFHNIVTAEGNRRY
jgi:hypothetical protein